LGDGLGVAVAEAAQQNVGVARITCHRRAHRSLTANSGRLYTGSVRFSCRKSRERAQTGAQRSAREVALSRGSLINEEYRPPFCGNKWCQPPCRIRGMAADTILFSFQGLMGSRVRLLPLPMSPNLPFRLNWPPHM